MHTDDRVFVMAAANRHAERFDIEQIGAGIPLPREAVALRQEDKQQ